MVPVIEHPAKVATPATALTAYVFTACDQDNTENSHDGGMGPYAVVPCGESGCPVIFDTIGDLFRQLIASDFWVKYHPVSDRSSRNRINPIKLIPFGLTS